MHLEAGCYVLFRQQGILQGFSVASISEVQLSYEQLSYEQDAMHTALSL